MAKKVTPKSAAPKSETIPAASPLADAPPAAAKLKSTKPRATPVVPSAAASLPSIVSDQMIAERAYHKWRNGEPGDPHHHWTTAERELRGGV